MTQVDTTLAELVQDLTEELDRFSEMIQTGDLLTEDLSALRLHLVGVVDEGLPEETNSLVSKAESYCRALDKMQQLSPQEEQDFLSTLATLAQQLADQFPDQTL